MARCLAKVSEEEIKTGFFYPSDLLNTKTTILLRVSEEQWICTLMRHVSVYIHHYSPPLLGIVVYYYFFYYHCHVIIIHNRLADPPLLTNGLAWILGGYFWLECNSCAKARPELKEKAKSKGIK